MKGQYGMMFEITKCDVQAVLRQRFKIESDDESDMCRALFDLLIHEDIEDAVLNDFKAGSQTHAAYDAIEEQFREDEEAMDLIRKAAGYA